VGNLRDAPLGTGTSFAAMISGLIQHNAYHAGQIAIMKKVCRSINDFIIICSPVKLKRLKRNTAMKILAIEKENPGVVKDQYNPFLKEEAKIVWELVQAGIIREIYFTKETIVP
jgi:hypothetical protein